MEIFDIEVVLKQKAYDSSQDTIRYALLKTLPPFADYSLAIKILRIGYLLFGDIQIAILISFLMSTWESHLENDYIILLNSLMGKVDSETTAMICYLNAYDIYMHNQETNRNKEYKRLLKKSIKLLPRSVYPYFYLSRMSPPSEARSLIDSALSNVKKVFTEQDCQQRSFDELISYDSFVNENIWGTEISWENYRRMQEY